MPRATGRKKVRKPGKAKAGKAKAGKGKKEKRTPDISDKEKWFYDEALRRISSWNDAHDPEVPLYLSFMQLTRLPPLPPDLRFLWCNNNNLTTLIPFGCAELPRGLHTIDCSANHLESLPPSLPPHLVILTCHNNWLREMPVLPASLQELRCYNNHLMRFHSPLPRALEHLDCEENLLVGDSFPSRFLLTAPRLRSFNCRGNPGIVVLPDLPPHLTFLGCDGTGLHHLPTLPASLTTLYCSNNSLTSLPSPLPAGLTSLSCSFNLLTALPESLPPRIREIYCCNNRLTTLPDELPHSVHVLMCDDNPFPVTLNHRGAMFHHIREIHADLKVAEERIARERSHARTATIKEELIMEMWAPHRLEKRLEAGEELEDLLG